MSPVPKPAVKGVLWHILEKHIPENSLALIQKHTSSYDVIIRISKPRKTKLGDFRPAHKSVPSRISINSDLCTDAFLITLLHEIAHLHIWSQFGRKVSAHGREWKQHFVTLLHEGIDADLFRNDVRDKLKGILRNPKASSLSNSTLCLTLGLLVENKLYLKELPTGTVFSLENNRNFVKGDLRRTRYACKSLENGKTYLIHGLAPVSHAHEQ